MAVTRGPRAWWDGYRRVYAIPEDPRRDALDAYDMDQLRRSLRPSHCPARLPTKPSKYTR